MKKPSKADMLPFSSVLMAIFIPFKPKKDKPLKSEVCLKGGGHVVI